MDDLNNGKTQPVKEIWLNNAHNVTIPSGAILVKTVPHCLALTSILGRSLPVYTIHLA